MSESKKPIGPPPIMQHIGYEVRTTFQAGYEQYVSWTSGKTKEHGFGWFHPFGKAEYFIGTGFDEEATFRDSALLGPFMLSMFDSKDFCIFKLNDGLLFALELGFGTLESLAEGERTAWYTVVVGGTGRFKGAMAVLQGEKKTVGHRETAGCEMLPRINIMETSGILKIPAKE